MGGLAQIPTTTHDHQVTAYFDHGSCQTILVMSLSGVAWCAGRRVVLNSVRGMVPVDFFLHCFTWNHMEPRIFGVRRNLDLSFVSFHIPFSSSSFNLGYPVQKSPHQVERIWTSSSQCRCLLLDLQFELIVEQWPFNDKWVWFLLWGCSNGNQWKPRRWLLNVFLFMAIPVGPAF